MMKTCFETIFQIWSALISLFAKHFLTVKKLLAKQDNHSLHIVILSGE